MGCTGSKLDESPALALCRQRCAYLDAALTHRYALADAHLAYLLSLKDVGLSIDRFFNIDPLSASHAPPSPVLNLPPNRKGDPESSSSPIHHLPSHSDSDSHLHFHSEDEDEDDSGSESLHHHDVSFPVHHLSFGDNFPDDGHLNLPGGRFMNINYMKNQATPSVLYTQRPTSPETMHMGGSSSYFPHALYSKSNYQNLNPPYPMYNSNSEYNGYSNYGGGAGFFGGSSPPRVPYGGGFPSNPAVASSSKPPPPPPSPPSSSGWDFLNPFESYEKYYPPYTPSRDSREVREEEGIPDLEDEDDEVVKEVHGNQKFVDSGRSSYSKPGATEEGVQALNDPDLQQRARQSVATETDPVEYDVHMVDKKVVDAEESSKDGPHAAATARPAFKGDLEVLREIKIQFERASESGNELAKFLEVGKLPYRRKHGGRHVSSRVLHLTLVPSLPSTSKSPDGDDPAMSENDQEVELRSRNLSSTLHKLYLWEKKLCEEVKVEEKLRFLHERKSKKLKHLDEKGAEAHKVDATRTLVRSLSTKIRIAIQVVDKISMKINNLRDEELWPQLLEFIQGLTRMWKSMLECHRNQCQAIGEAKRLDAIAFQKHFNDDHFEATQKLGHDLLNWTLRFTNWVGAQKGYVQSLNNWLMKCLLYVPEETPDGIVPFSPGRIGAPPVFVACNQWWQSLEGVSEMEVVDSMRDLASNVLQLWNRDKVEMRQRMLANKDERRIRGLDKEDQKIQKELQALDKKMVLISADNSGMSLSGNVVYQGETNKGGSLQASLQHVLEAMERFTTNSLKAYEELLQRIEEDHLSGEKEEASR